MPQLVKGGKYAYGWSKVGTEGRIVIPPEAVDEYMFTDGPVIVIPGSKRSGGFAVTTAERLKASQLSSMVDNTPLDDCSVPEGEIVIINGKRCCWVTLKEGALTVPAETLSQYGVSPGDVLLSVRGSGLALGFIVKGPIIEEARTHTLEIFE
jgi:bifunctional DNA-binding transcriptional regulator/antitoxin component of YhaV-PrlF toxin-antitoxin module